ncbi:Threonine/homoserine efflux transporter RhtA [Thermosipho atlanticus DSM 15807]|uniref:Threonine/homoserine efflux transporter RhtA n=1 Tax=Thermosipho atlanticus DSM 15807 TaxID=1123380 RepID=A0A1M5R8H5_9BACT|nr:Threonine/homoserine efflux transporter RhtA [Thermosipho atlanticus DSM 15807]
MFKVIISGISMSFIFGLSFLFTKNALDYTSPMNFIAIRFSIASFFMLTLLSLKLIRFQKKNYFKLLIVALFQPILYFLFETSGLVFVPSSEAGILIASIPIFITFLTPFVLKEKIKKINFLFVFTSFFGVVIIIGFNSLKGNIKGDLLILGAVFSAVFYNFTSRKFSKEFEPIEITSFMMFTGAIFFNILAFLRKELDYTALTNTHVLISAVYLGILSSSIAFFLVNYMLSKVSPAQSSIFANLTTVISVFAGAIFRNEQISFNHIIGMILIILGVWGVNYYNYRFSKEK